MVAINYAPIKILVTCDVVLFYVCEVVKMYITGAPLMQYTIPYSDFTCTCATVLVRTSYVANETPAMLQHSSPIS